MHRFTRRAAIAAFSVIALAACGAAETTNGETGTDASGDVALTDITLGSDDAPITMVEYASWTCPACLQFHTDVMPMLRTEYVDTGKVKFVFREFPTPPANVSVAGFALARCAGTDNYYAVIDDLFAAQTNVLNLARSGGDIAGALRNLASSYGIEGAAFEECLSNKDVTYAIGESVMKGDSQGVNSTPTVFINGEKLQGYDWRNADGMRAVLDARLGDEAPAETSAN
ncbi:MAG: thioredoxin domain-containing protein [Pseudomonadota bacterium]|jgi:protein-disulfide isomerase|nr:thioredoxin domain-containing protein [Pseudomonadota bacterium]